MDSAGSHKDFCAKEGLHFLLLSDPDAKVSTEYDSVMTYEGNKLSARNTYLIAPDGKDREGVPEGQARRPQRGSARGAGQPPEELIVRRAG